VVSVALELVRARQRRLHLPGVERADNSLLL
jgi:hypothetical protein